MDSVQKVVTFKATRAENRRPVGGGKAPNELILRRGIHRPEGGGIKRKLDLEVYEIDNSFAKMGLRRDISHFRAKNAVEMGCLYRIVRYGRLNALDFG